MRQLITGAHQNNHKNIYVSRLSQLTKHVFTSIIRQDAYDSPVRVALWSQLNQQGHLRLPEARGCPSSEVAKLGLSNPGLPALPRGPARAALLVSRRGQPMSHSRCPECHPSPAYTPGSLGSRVAALKRPPPLETL